MKAAGLCLSSLAPDGRPVDRVLRSFIAAFDYGVSTLMLTARGGNPIEVELSSVLELRDARRAKHKDALPEDADEI